MGRELAACVIERHRRRLNGRARRITIDLDPTDDLTHGAQQLTFFNGHYGGWCYLPMLGFLSFDREAEQYLCAAVLRPGKAVAADGTLGLLCRLLPLLRAAFPQARFLVRLDGGFATPEIRSAGARAGVMTWGVSTARRRPGDLLPRGDVCHLHADRDGAERCGRGGAGSAGPGEARAVLRAGVPGAVAPVGHVGRRAVRRPTGRGRRQRGRRAPPRLTAGAVPDADMIRAAADALGVYIVNLRRRRAGGQS